MCQLIYTIVYQSTYTKSLTCIDLQAHLYIYIYTHICIYLYLYLYIYYVYICLFVYLFLNIYGYICIYIFLFVDETWKDLQMCFVWCLESNLWSLSSLFHLNHWQQDIHNSLNHWPVLSQFYLQILEMRSETSQEWRMIYRKFFLIGL